MPPTAGSPFWFTAFLAVSVGLLAALGAEASFSVLLPLEASGFGSDEAEGLAALGGGGAGDLLDGAGGLAASGAFVVELGLSTAPWLVRTFDDKLPVAGAGVGVSLRSTRGATLGVEAGGGEAIAGALEGVP